MNRASGSATPSCASAVSVASGPSSTKVVAPSARSAVTASANRTASRACRAQYPGSDSSAAVARRPVSVETSGIRGVP